jgi:hypothetical protein
MLSATWIAKNECVMLVHKQMNRLGSGGGSGGGGGGASGGGGGAADAAALSPPATPAARVPWTPGAASCEVCGEAFRKEFDQDEEEYYIVDAARGPGGKIAHARCLRHA